MISKRGSINGCFIIQHLAFIILLRGNALWRTGLRNAGIPTGSRFSRRRRSTAQERQGGQEEQGLRRGRSREPRGDLSHLGGDRSGGVAVVGASSRCRSPWWNGRGCSGSASRQRGRLQASPSVRRRRQTMSGVPPPEVARKLAPALPCSRLLDSVKVLYRSATRGT